MLYTIGRTEAYERYFDTLPDLKKSGRESDYPGGSVWRTRTEAETYAATLSGYSVYGVIADWDRDTVPSADGSWHDLLVDSLLVRCCPDLTPGTQLIA